MAINGFRNLTNAEMEEIARAEMSEDINDILDANES